MTPHHPSDSLRTAALRRLVLGALLLASPALTAGALADVDVELRNGDRVIGTVDGREGAATFRVRVPAGARLTVVATGLRPGRREPLEPVSFRVADEDGNDVAPGQVLVRGRGARLRGFEIGASAEYRIEVAAMDAEVARYALRVVWRLPTRLRLRGESRPDVPHTVDFAADAGATLRFFVRGARRSRAVPRVRSIQSVEGAASAKLSPPPAEGVPVHRGTAQVPVSGEYRMTIEALDDDGGPISGSIRVRPLRTRTTLQLTDERLGASGANELVTARGALIGPDGGLVLFSTTDGGSIFEGATVEVPEGALSFPVPILIAGSSDVDPLAGAAGAGPSMFCGPSGTTFEGAQARVTMPFNTAPFDGELTGLRVLTRDDRGTVTEVDGDVAVDIETGRVSFPVSHFSSFRVVGPPLPRAAPGDLTGDGLGDLVIPVGNNLAGDGSGVAVFAGGPALLTQPELVTGLAAAVVRDDTASDSEFGRSFAVGDVDADGIADLAVSSSDRGAVYGFFGGAPLLTASLSSAGVIVTAGEPGAASGVASGDLNGDGIADVLTGEQDAGVAHLYSGRVRFERPGPNLLDRTSELVRELRGPAPSSLFGAAVAVADVTGDGVPDALVAAPGEGPLGAAVVYVVPGGAAAVDVSVGLLRRAVRLVGDAGDDAFGQAIATGDVNDDGFTDIVVAAPTATGGAAYLFLGGAAFAEGGLMRTRDYLITGPGEWFAQGVAVLDVDGDGIDDVVVAAPGFDETTALPDTGAASILLGSRRLRGGENAPEQTLLGNVSIVGEAGGDHFGIPLPATDVTGDGRPDLILAAPYYERFGDEERGRVYVFPGGSLARTSIRATAAPVTVTGAEHERLGAPFAPRIP